MLRLRLEDCADSGVTGASLAGRHIFASCPSRTQRPVIRQKLSLFTFVAVLLDLKEVMKKDKLEKG